jgi:hypothetical protein
MADCIKDCRADALCITAIKSLEKIKSLLIFERNLGCSSNGTDEKNEILIVFTYIIFNPNQLTY